MVQRTKTALILFLILSAPAYSAQKSSKSGGKGQDKTVTKTALETNNKSTLNLKKADPLEKMDLSINLDTSTSRDEDNKISGVDQTNRFYAGYQITPNDRLRSEARFVHSSLGQSGESENSFERLNFRYARTGLLQERVHGVAGKFEVELRYLPDRDVRTRLKRYSHLRLGPTLGKSFGSLVASAGLFYTMNQTLSTKYDQMSGYDDRQRSNWYLPLAQSYYFTDRLYGLLAQEIIYTHNASDRFEFLTLDLLTEVGYMFTDALYVGLRTGALLGEFLVLRGEPEHQRVLVVMRPERGREQHVHLVGTLPPHLVLAFLDGA